jgi:hypothetical protein
VTIQECSKAFWLEGNDARSVYNGSAKIIIKPQIFRFIMGKKYLLVDDEFAYGVIEFLKKPSRLSPSDFNDRREDHALTNIDKINRWRSGNKIVYAYDFNLVERFVKPKPFECMVELTDFVDMSFIKML